MVGFGSVDQEGDVEMTVPQPIFEFVKAPKLTAWSQPALVRFLRERRQYLSKVRERCMVTGEDENNVTFSIKSTVGPQIIEHLAHYVLRTPITEVMEEALKAEMERKAGNMMNDHVPDVAKLFAEGLKMDLREPDIEARVSKYFMDFDRLVEDQGLATWVGRGEAIDIAGRQRMKTRCKLLVDNLLPDVLRIDVERLVNMTHRGAKADDVQLYDVIVERAVRQQHYHLMQAETKKAVQGQVRTKKSQSDGNRKSETPRDTAKTSEGGAAREKTARPPPRDGCLICKGSHRAMECPTATREQKDEARRTLAARRAERLKHVGTGTSSGPSVTINGVLDVPFCADSGAESNILSRSMVDELCTLDSTVKLVKLEPPTVVKVAGGATMQCRDRVEVDLRISTAAGPLNISRVGCLVLDGDEDEFLLGRATMKDIGIDVNGLLEQLAGGASVAEADNDDVTEHEPELGFNDEREEIHVVVDKLVDEAVEAGFEQELADDLRVLVHEYADVWRLRIGADEPTRVEPMRITLRPDAQPYRSGVRKYPDMQRAFLRTYVQELLDNGLVRRNNSSRWACAALPVRKAGGDGFRITVDYRPVNKLTVPLAGTTPNLTAVTQSVRGAYGFGQFDLFKRFWQLPLMEECQELLSFVTEDGVFTPLRVPQGASDSAMHFQLQMHECFREMLYDSVLVWIDDVLLFSTSPAEFLAKLRVFFQILRQRNLKLNAKKCTLFAPKVIWCGKVIDGEEVQHDPARLATLRKMPLPPTAAALQTFLCAVNWLMDSMVDYARTVGPLQAKLEKVMATRGRRKSQLAGVDLSWSKADEDAFQLVLELLATSTKRYFADAEAHVCMFSDASARGWSVILTQVSDWDDAKPVTEQAHQLMVCRGGLFMGAQKNWSTVEQEAYPIVRACTDLAYLLERELGVRIYCDHANLIQIFAPDKELKQHVRGKLQRWALKMVGIRYMIEHIKGEDNLWADMVSRWGQRDTEPADKPTAVKRVTTRSIQQTSMLRPLQDESFVWPSEAAIRQEQQRCRADEPTSADEDGMFRVDGKLWIPADAKELLQRIFVVAHCGTQGHRGVEVMLSAVRQRFNIVRLRPAVDQFIRACLLCKHVKGGQLIQRPWGPTSTASQRNQCLHVDYIYLGASYGNDCNYVLVLKDELTHYCKLVPADTPTSTVAATAILDWYKRFGLPKEWIADNWSHFKAQVMEELAERLQASQKFVPVYTPWVNGTVERVNRDLLQVLRVMLLELQLDTRNWHYLLPVIQANLNHSGVESLGGHAPVELFAGLPAASPLDSVVVPVIDRKERKRLANMVRASGRTCNFVCGDFVLWSRVDKRLQGNKLLVRWVGPFRITDVLSHAFMVQYLLTGDVFEVHGSRLKHYSDATLDVTEELRQHIGNQGIVLGVRAIVQHRYHELAAEWQLYVAWRGLEDSENSWEPFASIYADVPALVRAYVEAGGNTELQELLH
ncbi:Hypothetical protein PHPALM_14828 [Phytophthora palmivora]|uniref:RNA-directed DNA polymerase n=1 Tax=Phytophthora palmivora TaxID=4796 RepID=A0A2P4XTQ4_9STRA|nr:Hypothetical protein PHPALM_14828 [Phytophthora palmivora]